MPRLSLIPLLLAISVSLPAAARAVSIPPQFDSVGTDRKAIEALLATYTNAVSTKDEALFETLLLNASIPFSGVGSSGVASRDPGVTNQYQAFREGVFGGSPFTQRFQDIHIQQDGPLASVSLVFVNTSLQGSSWG
ncbi:hypothetical protein [Sphingomonas abietis]|uniref:Nuclear transport factor 2 family protein n=1 Tax=Sphingomonas abietis TaxID=3012344 RepID=A0ABY7NPL6_9SPHN|nr:hypothetical protein [Sphingomonas abietis]WBO22895.1 hypothetical protein PBT88_01745 [Sphingomonas abietis]